MRRERVTADILPECSIHKILSYLSFGEAATTSIVSKTWQQAWLTHPNLEFRVHSGNGNMQRVNQTMKRYGDEKIPIDKFELNFTESDSDDAGEIFDSIGKWLDVALQNGVKEIVYRHYCSSLNPPPVFPIFDILATKSLRELVLRGCDLMLVLLSTSLVASYDSLRKLSLSYVRLDENLFQALLNSCPLITTIVVDRCIGLKNIELLNLQNIRSVSVWADKKQRVKIQAPNLEHLFYSGFFEALPRLDIVECQNLKTLELSCMSINYGFLEHLMYRCQSLESLSLDRLYEDHGKFNIFGGQSLKVLKIHYCKGIEVIDAPNLVSLEYMGDEIPELRVAAKEPSQLKHSRIVLECWSNLDVAWFCKLRRFLSNSTFWPRVSLHFFKCIEINSKELQLQHSVATHQVDVLDVYINSSSICPTFVDALSWSCRPRRLNLR